jgi:hypothetical protein
LRTRSRFIHNLVKKNFRFYTGIRNNFQLKVEKDKSRNETATLSEKSNRNAPERPEK